MDRNRLLRWVLGIAIVLFLGALLFGKQCADFAHKLAGSARTASLNQTDDGVAAPSQLDRIEKRLGTIGEDASSAAANSKKAVTNSYSAYTEAADANAKIGKPDGDQPPTLFGGQKKIIDCACKGTKCGKKKEQVRRDETPAVSSPARPVQVADACHVVRWDARAGRCEFNTQYQPVKPGPYYVGFGEKGDTGGPTDNSWGFNSFVNGDPRDSTDQVGASGSDGWAPLPEKLADGRRFSVQIERANAIKSPDWAQYAQCYGKDPSVVLANDGTTAKSLKCIPGVTTPKG